MASNTSTSPDVATSRKDSRRALVSSFLGTTVEYYDFLLYASASALVFPKLFFPETMDKGLGTVLSFVILLIGYIARPVGGIIFGHFGDLIGRKKMLFITLIMMGGVSTLIGLLPTYAAIGAAAPLALVGLRTVQGLAIGGEWAGATLMAAEHVTQKRRGIAASIAVTGGPTGSVLATLMLSLFAGLPEEHFLSWGWRLPFLFSAILVIIGLYLRYRVAESPDFVAAKEKGDAPTGIPIVRVFKQYPGAIVTGTFAAAGPLFMQALLAVFMVPYVAGRGVVTVQHGLWLLAVSSLLHIVAIPYFAWLSDRYGRRPIMLLGAGISVTLVFPMIWLFNSDSVWLVALAFIVGNPIIQASMYGPIGAFLAEKFDTTARYTGASLTFQLGSALGAGTGPLMAKWLIDLGNGKGLVNIGFYFVLLIAIAALCVLLSPETRKVGKNHQDEDSDSMAESVSAAV